MKIKRVLLVLVVGFLSVALGSLAFLSLTHEESTVLPEDFYLGVTASGNVTETKLLIDKIKGYTNLVAFTNLEVTKNQTTLDEVADYAVQAGLSFMVHMSYPTSNANFTYNPFTWIPEAEAKYGARFVGVYLYDEPGGSQLDRGSFRQFDNTTMPYDYRDAANTYVYYLFLQMRDFIKTDRLFTSDYALYWYDYEAGYDTVLCQLGWNNSRAVNIALCRGAAEMHNKTWGAMIAWTYRDAPYIESAPEMYQDMVDSYEAGAKYVIVFNYPTYPKGNPYGILSEDHFEALKQFSQYVSMNPQNGASNTEQVAYVLPDNYGWGFRSANDTIWGVWTADNRSQTIWDGVAGMVQKYGYNFDIVYGSPWTLAFGRIHYDRLILWNATQTS